MVKLRGVEPGSCTCSGIRKPETVGSKLPPNSWNKNPSTSTSDPDFPLVREELRLSYRCGLRLGSSVRFEKLPDKPGLSHIACRKQRISVKSSTYQNAADTVANMSLCTTC